MFSSHMCFLLHHTGLADIQVASNHFGTKVFQKRFCKNTTIFVYLLAKMFKILFFKCSLLYIYKRWWKFNSCMHASCEHKWAIHCWVKVQYNDMKTIILDKNRNSTNFNKQYFIRFKCIKIYKHVIHTYIYFYLTHIASRPERLEYVANSRIRFHTQESSFR